MSTGVIDPHTTEPVLWLPRCDWWIEVYLIVQDHLHPIPFLLPCTLGVWYPCDSQSLTRKYNIGVKKKTLSGELSHMYTGVSVHGTATISMSHGIWLVSSWWPRLFLLFDWIQPSIDQLYSHVETEKDRNTTLRDTHVWSGTHCIDITHKNYKVLHTRVCTSTRSSLWSTVWRWTRIGEWMTSVSEKSSWQPSWHCQNNNCYRRYC